MQISRARWFLVIATMAVGVSAGAKEPLPPAASAKSAVPSVNDERQTITRFYDSYLSYLRSLKDRARKPKVASAEDRAVVAAYLTDGLKKKLRANEAKCAANKNEILPGCGGDPFYCGQETPKEYVIAGSPAPGLVQVNFKDGSTTPKIIDLRLKKVGSRWLIDQLACR